MRMPLFTLPRTSPEMYAEYWKPMNWKSMTPAMNMTGQLRPFTGPKLKPLVSPAVAAAAASWSTVTPFVYFGRLAANCAGSKKTRPRSAIRAQPMIPITVR